MNVGGAIAMRKDTHGVDRRALVVRAAAVGLAFGVPGLLLRPTAAEAQAEGWPNRPVRFIVPLAAGGGLDFIARLVAEPMSRAIGQQVVIENRTGAGGTIGIETAMKSPPDGYSILVTNDNVAAAPHVLRLDIDYGKNFLPVIQLGRQTLALAAHPSLGVSTVAELIEAAKQRPGLGCATSGVGSNQHVLLEWFVKMAGVRLDHVPYRGAGQAINDLIAGHVQIGLLGPTALIPHYRAGSLRLLAQSSDVRSPSLPEVPTLQEAGFSGLVLESWYAAFAPVGTPPAIVARLNAELEKALADATVRARLRETAIEPAGGTPEHLARVVATDSAKYARLVKELNIKLN